MTAPALDLTRLDDLLEYSRSIAFGDWVASASGPDLHQAHHALENFAVLCASELARRAWSNDPRTYRPLPHHVLPIREAV